MTDFKRYLLDEFVEDYQEGHLSRRETLKLIAGLTGSLALANSIVAACTPASQATSTSAPAPTSQPAAAPTTPPTAQPTSTPAQATTTEPTTVPPGEMKGRDVEFPGQDATLMGYLALPAGSGTFPAVLVCHENRGLTEHIKDVTHRVATAGYVGLAVDLLSRQGGTAAVGDSSQAPGILGNTPPEQFVQDFISGWRWLQSQPLVQADRVGMVGFCFGGGVTWRVAIGLPELRAAVPFYGPHPSPDEVASIQAAMLAIYGELDQRINQGIPAIEAAMQQNGKVYEKVVYPNADHAFHNDTGSRYNPEAAQDAWARTLDWFEQYLKTT